MKKHHFKGGGPATPPIILSSQLCWEPAEPQRLWAYHTAASGRFQPTTLEVTCSQFWSEVSKSGIKTRQLQFFLSQSLTHSYITTLLVQH